jgi:hypothetical protein
MISSRFSRCSSASIPSVARVVSVVAIKPNRTRAVTAANVARGGNPSDEFSGGLQS